MSTLLQTKPLKACKICKQSKPKSYYTKDSGEKDGLNRYCRTCVQDKRIEKKQEALRQADELRSRLLSLSLAQTSLDKSIISGGTQDVSVKDIFGALPTHSRQRVYDVIKLELNRLIMVTEEKFLNI